MSRAVHLPSPAAVALARRRVAAVAVHLLERQAADLPRAQQNELDRRMAKAVAQAGVAGPELVRAATRVRQIPPARRAELFDGPTLDLAPEVAIDLDRIRDIVDQLGPIELPEPGEPRPVEVTFSHLVCTRQESLVGSDEPYIVFGIVSPDGLSPGVRTVTTPIYTEVDPGNGGHRRGHKACGCSAKRVPS